MIEHEDIFGVHSIFSYSPTSIEGLKVEYGGVYLNATERILLAKLVEGYTSGPETEAVLKKLRGN